VNAASQPCSIRRTISLRAAAPPLVLDPRVEWIPKQDSVRAIISPSRWREMSTLIRLPGYA
jgi:hypothetical protein